MSTHRWRSDLLGEARSLDATGGTLEYFDRGEGPTLLFSHGWLANANLWRKVVDLLSERYAKALANGRLVRIEDAYGFTPEDQPAAVAAAIRAFAS